MPEPDLGGIGGVTSSEGSGNGPGIFRAASKVNLDYKDVTGLVKEMNALYDAIKKVKSAIDSLDEGKTRDALKNLSAGLSGGGGVGSGGGGRGPTMSNGGNSTFGGLSPGMALAGVGLSAAALVAGGYANRKQSDLFSDVTSMRVTLASGNPSFGLNQANALVRNTLGPTSFGRDDMNTAAQSIFGRYGTANSSGTQAALTTSAALARMTMQGASFGADLMNSANDPTVLNRIRKYTGVTMGQFTSSTQMSDILVKAAFGTANPSQNLFDSFRPGTRQYSNMMMLTGGNAALGQVAVDEAQAKGRYYANGGKGAWNDKTISGMSDDMQKKIFGADSLFIAQQRVNSGKAISQEAGLSLARSGLVQSDVYLYNIQQATKEVSQKLTQYLAPLGNMLGGISGPLSQLGNILTPLALLARTGGGLPSVAGIAGKLGIGGGAGGEAAAAAGGGMSALGGLLAVGGGAVLGHILGNIGGGAINHLTGRKTGQKGGFNWGNVFSRTATGAGAGAGAGLLGGPLAEVTVPVGAAAGAIVGGLSGIGHEFGIGDPAPGGDQSRGADGGPSMSLTDATKLLLSRNRGGSAAAVNNMAPDLRLKLGKLFSANPLLSLSSGWRSKAEQQKLYDLYKSGKGNLAAKPGTSNHEKGLAADIGPNSQYGWLASNARSAGLVRPMSGEPWHWEPPDAKTRGGGSGSASDGGPTDSPLARMVMASVQGASPGGADQWVGSDSAPSLSGISIRALAGGGTAVSGSDSSGGSASTAWDGGGPGKLSINNAAKLASSAGIPTSQIPLAVAIAMAESGLNPHDHNARPPDDSYGLWQINMYKGLGPDRRKRYHLSADSQLYDPSKNAEAMADISSHGKNWGPWSTYGSGAYKKYMGDVNHALSSGVGDPVAQSPSPVSFGAQSAAVNMRGGSRSNTTVNVHVMYASYDEAVRIARIVKDINDGPAQDVDNARTGI